jgi:hypothetical protein
MSLLLRSVSIAGRLRQQCPHRKDKMSNLLRGWRKGLRRVPGTKVIDSFTVKFNSLENFQQTAKGQVLPPAVMTSGFSPWG